MQELKKMFQDMSTLEKVNWYILKPVADSNMILTDSVIEEG